MKYNYVKSTRSGSEAVEFDIIGHRGQYITTCVVNVYMLLIGHKTHPCGNGDDVKLTDEQALEILKLVQQERNAIKYSRQVKSLAGWRESGLNLDEYLAVGDEVDEELVDEQMNVVPPRRHEAGYLQVGEPYADAPVPDDPQRRYRATYSTYHMKRDGDRQYWIFAGHCFTGEDVNRLPERDRVQEAIDTIKGGGDPR